MYLAESTKDFSGGWIMLVWFDAGKLLGEVFGYGCGFGKGFVVERDWLVRGGAGVFAGECAK